MTEEPTTRTQVLVVGGALTGLSTALFLARHGVDCTLVERHPDLLRHPRLRGATPRTVELFRQVGLEGAIRASSYADGDRMAWTPVIAETLAGEYTTPEEEDLDERPTTAYSPAPFGTIDQDKLEVLLRDRASELGARLRFSAELASFTQDDAGIAATLVDPRTGDRETLRADYLVAADGAGSQVRHRLGVESDGPGILYNALTAIVEADLAPALRGRPVSIAYLSRPRPHSNLMNNGDQGRRWVFAMGYDPESEAPDDFDADDIIALVRDAAGLPDVEVRVLPQIPGTDRTTLGFPIGAMVARQYSVGRVFLVGDAAHIMPPTGGLGGNTGVQDAHNLAWKLAAVVRGQASPALLDTYHTERRPVGRMTMGQALARFGTRMGAAEADPIISHLAVSYGYQYRSPAVPGASGEPTPLHPSELAGQPGTRAPHVSLATDDADTGVSSTIDLYGTGFALLTGPGDRVWRDAAENVAKETGVGVRAHALPAAAAAVHGIDSGGAVLVRPDGFVAWRSGAPAGDAARALGGALRAVLGG